MLKKTAIAFGVLVALLVTAAVIVPLVVDVDKYRPQIVEKANEQINGKLELGKLSLSLWGQIRIEVAGVSLSDSSGNKVISVNDAYFHIPFLSVLTGSPELTFKMQHPIVNVVKNKVGKMNVMTLVKSQSPATNPQAQPSGNTTAAAPSKSSSGNVSIPGIAARARLGIELTDAELQYRDESTGLTSKLENLNLLLKDISLSHPTQIEFWADIDTTMGKTFALKGPARLKGTLTPALSGNQFDHATLVANLDLDDLAMTAPGVFEKKKGMACDADLSVLASPKQVTIDHLTLKFFNAEITVSGSVNSLAFVDLNVKSNDIDFKPWVQLVPMLKDYDLGGTASLQANAKGTADKLGYSAKFKVNALTAKAPHLKAEPRIDALVSVATDQIDNLTLTMKAPGNDLNVHGKLVSFSKPHGDFQVTSTGMDIDQLVDFPPPAKKEAAPANSGKNETSSAKAPAENFDVMLAPLRENKMLASTVVNVGVDMKMLKAYGVKITDIVGKIYLNDLSAGVDGFGMKVFSGSIKSSLNASIKSSTPTYKLSALVDGLDLAQAVESQLALFKNTVIGKAHFELNGEGASFNPQPATANLKAKGNMKITNATFTTIDIGKMAMDSISGAIGKVTDKFPQLKGKINLGSAPNTGSKYEFISADFTIAGGKFNSPNFYAKSVQNQGIDAKGSTIVGLNDYSLKSDWDIIDTWDVTKAKEVKDPLGQNISIFADSNGVVHFPMTIGCTIMAPCYDKTQVATALMNVAANNMTKALTGQAKSQVANKLIQQAPPSMQGQLNDLKKKFGF